jgi:hypothetical protein
VHVTPRRDGVADWPASVRLVGKRKAGTPGCLPPLSNSACEVVVHLLGTKSLYPVNDVTRGLPQGPRIANTRIARLHPTAPVLLLSQAMVRGRSQLLVALARGALPEKRRTRIPPPPSGCKKATTNRRITMQVGETMSKSVRLRYNSPDAWLPLGTIRLWFPGVE